MKRIKWLLLSGFICAGIWVAVIAPQAVENFLPEVNTTFPEVREYRETVRGHGVIQSIHRGSQIEYYLLASVRERDINAVKVGQPAQLYGVAIGDGVFTAVVKEIANEAQRIEMGGILETVVDVVLKIDYVENHTDNHDRLIRPGYTALAVIGIDEPREILLISYEAINQDDRGEYVLILRGNTAVRRDIITGVELVEGAEVISGVREGDELILRPERLEENSLVRRTYEH